MNIFFKVLLHFILFIFLSFLLTVNPDYSLAVSALIAVVTGIAIFKPIPKLGLGSRIYSAIVFIFIGAFGVLLSLTEQSTIRAKSFQALKTEDPDAYLAELKATKPELWLSELGELYPEQYKAELARQTAATKKKAFAEAAANVAKRDAERLSKERGQCGSSNRSQAYFYAQFYVEDRLQSPSSADFPHIHYKEDVSSTAIGDCTFRVKAYVDAQNLFGVVVRTPFTVILKRFPHQDGWQLISVEFGQ